MQNIYGIIEPQSQPKIVDGEQHIRLLTGSSHTAVWFRAFDDSGTDPNKAQKFFGTVAECWPKIEQLQSEGCGIFVVVNEGGNRDEEITGTRALFVDADGNPVPDNWHQEPDFIVRRGERHWHAYWPVKDLPVAEFKQAQMRLATHYGTDTKVCNPSRVMRLAGTYHLKDPENPRPVILEDRWGTTVRTAAELLASLPELSAKAAAPRKAASSVDLSNPANLYRAERIAIDWQPGENYGHGGGGGSDGATICLANRLMDYVTPETAAAIMVEHWMPRCIGQWEPEWIAAKVESAAKSRQNEIGCDAVRPASKLFPAAELHSPNAQRLIDETNQRLEPSTAGAKRRFQSRLPSEDEKLPPLTYYDAEQTMPCLPDGGVLIATGKTQSHKTGLVIKKCLDAIERTRARVLYLAAEGAHGIRTNRLPTYRRERKMAWETLDAHWRTLSASFDPFNASDRAELIEQYREFNPNIIAMDTLTRVVPGQDINAPSVGTSINVYADELAGAFGALVILIHHPGKDDSRGSLGSALIESLAYAVWRVSKDGNTVRCWVDKMKDGPAEFAAYYGIAWTTPGNVPCVRDQTAAERSMAERQSGADLYRAHVRLVIDEARRVGATTLDVLSIADKLVTDIGPDRERHIRNEVRRLQRKIKGKPGAPGILADLVKCDRRGEPLEPYEFVIPEPENI